MKSGMKWGALIVLMALLEWGAMEYLARHYTRRLFREFDQYTKAGKLYDINTRIGKQDGQAGF